MTTEQLRDALDAAVLTHRADPTDENRASLMAAGEAYRDDFFRREVAEAQARTH